MKMRAGVRIGELHLALFKVGLERALEERRRSRDVDRERRDLQDLESGLTQLRRRGGHHAGRRREGRYRERRDATAIRIEQRLAADGFWGSLSEHAIGKCHKTPRASAARAPDRVGMTSIAD